MSTDLLTTAADDILWAQRLAASTGTDLLGAYLDLCLTCVRVAGCRLCAREAKVYQLAINLRRCSDLRKQSEHAAGRST